MKADVTSLKLIVNYPELVICKGYKVQKYTQEDTYIYVCKNIQKYNIFLQRTFQKA